MDVKPAHWLQLTDIILGNSLQSQVFLSDSQQGANWIGDNSWLLSSPTVLQIEAHLNSDSMSSIQLLNVTSFPTAETHLLNENSAQTVTAEFHTLLNSLTTGLRFYVCHMVHTSCGTASGMCVSPVSRQFGSHSSVFRLKRSLVEKHIPAIQRPFI